jgi:hypothetical protein
VPADQRFGRYEEERPTVAPGEEAGEEGQEPALGVGGTSSINLTSDDRELLAEKLVLSSKVSTGSNKVANKSECAADEPKCAASQLPHQATLPAP